jgi:3-(3-hydroxy-phenyl)propionate hydroxylase
MIKAAVDMKTFVSVANPVLALLRNILTRTAAATPKLGTIIREGQFIPQPEYQNGNYFGLPRSRGKAAAGKLLPQPSMRCSDGKSRLLDDLLGNGFALLGLGVDPRSALRSEDRAFWESLGTSFVAAYTHGGRPQGNISRTAPQGIQVAEDVSGELYAWLTRRQAVPGDIVIVRPDRFVFAVVSASKLASATQAVAEQLNRPAAASADQAVAEKLKRSAA